MLAQRRIGCAKRRSSGLSARRSCRSRKTSDRRGGRELTVLREVNRRGLQMCTSSADLIDDEFDELDCSPEILLQLVNQL